ncbi:discoidin domain-containing protein [Paenibacillus sp. J5C_2022]|uniref:discoidin domain-containing protein n=1 Tax=Paenibacillus sp. J5C2022 TaxID=2977129 RepID=UPI0021CFB29A|nr:discoidin domain-containing protein [Paenibacillus sp. J5C2022]MCU6709167.1 discoidin domain-containing protein [Paenibacillus sp. J5C2022]
MNKRNRDYYILMVMMFLFAIVFIQPDKSEAAGTNVSVGKSVYASGNEVDWLGPGNAVDGDSGTRWSSAKDDGQWFYVDLGEVQPIAKVVIHWQTPADKYQILVSKDKVNWDNVMENDGILTAAAQGPDVIEFQQRQARYVKFQGVSRRPVEGIVYGYSFFEFEVYNERNALPEIMEELRQQITVQEGQTELVLPAIREGYKVSLLGSDRLPVIDQAGRIHEPLVDVKVHLLLQVENVNDPQDKLSDNVLVTVPGLYEQTAERNAEPMVVPSLQEWLGGQGEFTLSGASRIVVDEADLAALQKTADILRDELHELTGLSLAVETGTPDNGDIYLRLDQTLAALGEEGYRMDINDYASIFSDDVKGVFYGTRTVLQLLEQDDAHTRMPRGMIRDYPKYAERGFMIDVARKFYTIDFLRDYVKLMSYYKMNRFQIHLNDDVGTAFPDGTKAAFRLESERYPGLASPSGYYTKEEFRELQQLGMDYGVNVVPEIDTPGHSGVFIAYDPSLGSGNMLDVTREETVDFVKGLFDEYIDDNVFIGPDVHIGTDEYWGSDTEAFRQYMDTFIRHINGKGKQARLWGGLTMFDGNTPISNDATMDIWYEPYGSAQQAVDLGYDIVNVNTNLLYIVPQLYRNYLNYDYLYNEWEPNDWIESVLPFGHSQVKGAMFALWNDVSIEKGVSMADSHYRVLPSMKTLSEKTWAGTREDRDFIRFQEELSKLHDPPTVHLSHVMRTGNEEGKVAVYSFNGSLADASGNEFHGAGHRMELVEGLFGEGARLQGGDSYVDTPLRSLGFGWTLSMWVKPEENNPADAVLLESPEGQLRMNMGGSGKLGFVKEGYSSVFDYKLPAGKWTHLLLVGDSSSTSLFVNGSQYAESLRDGTKLETFILPLARIGSATNAFQGVVDQVEVFNRAIDVRGNLALLQSAQSSGSESQSLTPDKAVDGRSDTRWSSEWVDDAWFAVDLGEAMAIDKVAIAWQTAYAKRYQLLVSADGENWVNAISGNDGVIQGKGGVEELTFPPIEARYVKMQGIERATIFGYSFQEFEVFSSERAIGNKTRLAARITGLKREELAQNAYTADSWELLQDTLASAELTLMGIEAKQADLDAAWYALINARAELAKKAGTPSTPNYPSYPGGGTVPEVDEDGDGDEAEEENAAAIEWHDMAGHWAEGYISRAAKLGFVKGFPDGTFRGDMAVTREQFIVMLANALKLGGDGAELAFADNGDIGDWARTAIAQAIEAGILTGYADGTFRPKAEISRMEMAAMLVRALQLSLDDAADPSYRDANDMPQWAKPYIMAAYQSELMTGKGGERFAPAASATRAEAVTVILRMLERESEE